MEKLTGKCLCGGVAFEAIGGINRTSACYCKMCRMQNGGGAFHSAEIEGELNLIESESLRWYAASDKAERGFCAICGSSLFWRLNANPAFTDISLGTLDDTSSVTLDAHIFVDNAANYQTIPGGVARFTEAECLAKYNGA